MSMNVQMELINAIKMLHAATRWGHILANAKITSQGTDSYVTVRYQYTLAQRDQAVLIFI